MTEQKDALDALIAEMRAWGNLPDKFPARHYADLLRDQLAALRADAEAQTPLDAQVAMLKASVKAASDSLVMRTAERDQAVAALRAEHVGSKAVAEYPNKARRASSRAPLPNDVLGPPPVMTLCDAIDLLTAKLDRRRTLNRPDRCALRANKMPIVSVSLTMRMADDLLLLLRRLHALRADDVAPDPPQEPHA